MESWRLCSIVGASSMGKNYRDRLPLPALLEQSIWCDAAVLNFASLSKMMVTLVYT